MSYSNINIVFKNENDKQLSLYDYATKLAQDRGVTQATIIRECIECHRDITSQYGDWKAIPTINLLIEEVLQKAGGTLRLHWDENGEEKSQELQIDEDNLFE